MRNWNIALLLLPGFLIFNCSSLYSDTPAEFRSNESQTHLVELFSSEGCSSCPPADSWLASLRSKPELWKKFVPIEFHVDYWNRLGWVDQLSKSYFTERQQSYAREWGNWNVYTPGFVFDGSEWRGASSGTPPWEAGSDQRPGVLSVKRIGKLKFSITFNSLKPFKQIHIYGALLGNGLESTVNSGENSGSVLRHEFAVLSFTQGKSESKNSKFESILDLAPAINDKAKSYSIAFWVTEVESQKPIQAVGGDLKL